jgi:hypothetical protein
MRIVKVRRAGIAVLLGCVLMMIALVLPALRVNAAPGDVCPPLSSGKIDVSGEQTSITITAPSGYLISGYCVKAGSDQGGTGGPVFVTVDPPMQSVTITYPGGKAISHYSVTYVPVSTPTTTTTTSPTSTTTTTSPTSTTTTSHTTSPTSTTTTSPTSTTTTSHTTAPTSTSSTTTAAVAPTGTETTSAGAYGLSPVNAGANWTAADFLTSLGRIALVLIGLVALWVAITGRLPRFSRVETTGRHRG